MENQSSVYNKLWLIAKRRWLQGTLTFIPAFLILVLAVSWQKPIYLAQGKLRFQRTNTSSALTGVNSELGKLEPLVEKSNPLKTEAEVLSSTPIIQKTITKLNLQNKHGEIIKPKIFIQKLSVKNIQGTDILEVAYKDTSPEIAAKVVNMLMEVYVEHNITSQRSQAVAARKFLEEQVPKAEFAARQTEIDLRQFLERNNVASIPEEVTQSAAMITDLQKQINANESKIADLNSQSQELQKQLGMSSKHALMIASLSQSSGVQDLLKELQQQESQLAAKQTIFQDIHPDVSNLQTKVAALKSLLNQRIKQVAGSQQIQGSNLQMGTIQQQMTGRLVELEATRLGLISQLKALSNLQNDAKKRFNILPKLGEEQRGLERKLQAAQSAHSLQAQKLQEVRVAENQNLGNVHIIAASDIPSDPASSPQTSYVAAAILAMIASMGTMYFLELKDKSVKTIDEAKKILNLTLLGVIPVSKSKKSSRSNEDIDRQPKLIVRDTPRSPISEAYRMLRANLKFISADKEIKVIVVTSSVAKEGKSTVCANLAVSMAQIEHNVLLIDADLHSPVQHQIWDLHNDIGLSNTLVGQAQLKTAIKKVMPNLDVLTSGVMPPSPAALLDSKRMAALIETLAANYDLIIIDTPPLNIAADAASIGQIADGVLLVVRPGVVDSVSATFAKELLEKSGQNVLGQVVNGVIPDNEPHSYHYFADEYSGGDGAVEEDKGVTHQRSEAQ